MQTITFTCEVITPMFLAGADSTTPELRPASIKGALRFWWRAMNGHLSVDEMRKLEGEIFGSTEKRSRIIIKEPKPSTDYSPLKYDGNSSSFMLPHKPEPKDKEKDSRSLNKAFLQKSTFKIELTLTSSISVRYNNSDYTFTINSLRSLFILTSILGGLGKRSRRGFGSFRITNINNQAYSEEQNLENLLPCMNLLVVKNSVNEDKFKIDRNRILLNSKSSYRDLGEFPYVTKIQIGTQVKTVSEIGNSTHKVMLSDAFLYKSTVGAGNPRFASPIYISILKDNLPIITTLKTVSHGGKKWSLQTDLKNEIL
ncbi:type III-B CRISPR module RAMP protein Cmr1 [Runella sp. MFBS21]|uniref:type III-B CRISPR module RAMP protein Cmr1 n=1 Tax=Runella sp. MFBS21 TaxID=3034018 RepID=UPI0023F8687F|nr:type III-B CRISPR module RAMP protein Cmr1 [Runella sp. MFBS21]MDF7818116.1 type III-B CRISPR module RAMP protein Cmr1 [Runella sp. MFBS21]